MLAMVRRQRTFCHHAQTNALSLEYSSLFGVLPRMMEVSVTKRRRSWEWRVNDDNGTLLMRGRERSRPAARYQCYRSLFLLLAVGRKSTAVRASETYPRIDQSNSGASRSWSS